MKDYDKRLVAEIQAEVDKCHDGLRVYIGSANYRANVVDWSAKDWSIHLFKLLEIVRLVAMPPEDGGTDRMDAQAMRSLRAVIRGDCSDFTQRDGEGFNVAMIRYIGELRNEAEKR